MRLNVLRSFQASAEQQTPQDSTQQQIGGRKLMSAMPAVPVSCSECVELQDVDAYLAIGPVEVVLCASIRNERQLREVLLHELVHACTIYSRLLLCFTPYRTVPYWLWFQTTSRRGAVTSPAAKV
jgi:hypothetical protein